MCKLRIAVNTRIKDRETQQWSDKPELLRRHRLGRPGRELARYLQKGSGILIDGRLEWREWDAQDGTKRQSVEIIAENTQFIGGRESAAQRGGGGSEFTPEPARAACRRVPAARRRRHPVLGLHMSHRRTLEHGKPRRRPREAQARPGHRRRRARRRCHFCKDKVEEIDYKNVNQLRRYVSEKGKIRSRRITGACRRHQRQVAVAIKRAREMALLPYVAG